MPALDHAWCTYSSVSTILVRMRGQAASSVTWHLQQIADRQTDRQTATVSQHAFTPSRVCSSGYVCNVTLRGAAGVHQITGDTQLLLLLPGARLRQTQVYTQHSAV